MVNVNICPHGSFTRHLSVHSRLDRPHHTKLTAAVAMLEDPTTMKVPDDDVLYHVGRIGSHFVVIVVYPRIGNEPAATVLANIRRSFSNIKHVLVVGIAGGMPRYSPDLQEQIVLGDIVVHGWQGMWLDPDVVFGLIPRRPERRQYLLQHYGGGMEF
ncbi:hypothetical protein QR685DRAFT_214650 [Neurospora intermedia]|uniref:Nucleoside phosphorylase domain-containing protein n=1 Tax=Neurospora intermedia TaxID=5142 RepID=A0ABR3DGK0_NEUIN